MVPPDRFNGEDYFIYYTGGSVVKQPTVMLGERGTTVGLWVRSGGLRAVRVSWMGSPSGHDSDEQQTLMLAMSADSSPTTRALA